MHNNFTNKDYAWNGSGWQVIPYRFFTEEE
jgi:hypothetical protein